MIVYIFTSLDMGKHMKTFPEMKLMVGTKLWCLMMRCYSLSKGSMMAVAISLTMSLNSI